MAKSWYQTTGLQSDKKWKNNSDVFRSTDPGERKKKRKRKDRGGFGLYPIDLGESKPELYGTSKSKMLDCDNKKRDFEPLQIDNEIYGWDL